MTSRTLWVGPARKRVSSVWVSGVLGAALSLSSAGAQAQSAQEAIASPPAQAEVLAPMQVSPRPEAPPRRAHVLFGVGLAGGGAYSPTYFGGGVDLKLGAQLNERLAVYANATFGTALFFNEGLLGGIVDWTFGIFSVGTGVLAGFSFGGAPGGSASAAVIAAPLAMNLLFGPTDPVTGRRWGFNLGLRLDVGLAVGQRTIVYPGATPTPFVEPNVGGTLTLGYMLR